MARTIIEDYLNDNRGHFDLAYDIPRRAREILRQANAQVPDNNDKPIVLALREISEKREEKKI